MRVIAIGLGVWAVVAAANAKEQARLPPHAAIDASGRAVPPVAGAAERIDSASPSSPCEAGLPLPADEARALVKKIATDENLPAELVLSVARSESRFNSVALSEKGAFGLMQLTPETARRFQVDLCDPAANVRGGVRFLKVLQEKYRNPLIVLAAYNAGEAAVEQSRGVPPYPETVRFVAQVLGDIQGWPVPGGSARRSQRGVSLDGSDLIVPAAQGAGAPRADPEAAPRWDHGFVMHLD